MPITPTAHDAHGATNCAPIWVTISDAQRLSGLGRTTIYELLAAGRLRGINIGRRRLVSFASIAALGDSA